MPRPSPRRLNLLDGMIVMAGVASCFLLTRLYMDAYSPRFTAQVAAFENYGFVRRSSPLAYQAYLPVCWYVAEGCKVATLWLAMFSPIVLLLRLRRPRPGWRRIVAQPGTVATLLATLVAAMGIVIWTAAAALAGQGPGLFFYTLGFARFLAHAGSAIALAWTIQLIGRRGAPEASLLDRTGRLLGLAWVVVFLLLAAADFEQQILIEQVPDNERYTLFMIRSRLEN